MLWCTVLIVFLLLPVHPQEQPERNDHDQRMEWWREARFGMFIHWGLYSILEGAWRGQTDYGEWIRNNAEIPLEVYDTLRTHFDPVRFNAVEWARMARQAGMRYMVLTSKHHDGFCLFESRHTHFDVSSTPFDRDIIRELAEACRKEGIVFGLYYSIMDWHHPDYLPRRPWETKRSSDEADYSRYVTYMKDQLRELLTNYGPIGILWFDGEWESTWTDEMGTDLYHYVRSIQPDIIINNRVGASREGMAGTTPAGRFGGDFGTPEQQVPSTGIPGVDWESCMTMNENWGFNRADTNFKTVQELVRTLIDIASKGGNFLLNVGPLADGTFPEESVDRLARIGQWMAVHGESIYGTTASPFRTLPWGRSTEKRSTDGTIIYIHVFDWPEDHRVRLPGLLTPPERTVLLQREQEIPVELIMHDDAVELILPQVSHSPIASVLKLEFDSDPTIVHAPDIASEQSIFLDTLHVSIGPVHASTEIRYTLDGTIPDNASPVTNGNVVITRTVELTARYFREGRPVSATSRASFEQVTPRSAEDDTDLVQGLSFSYYEGEWERLPDFQDLEPVRTGVVSTFTFEPRREKERFGFVYDGFVRVPRTDIYTFALASDDGSTLRIADTLLIDNDGLHGMRERTGSIALEKGVHHFHVEYFERTGGDGLRVRMRSSSSELSLVQPQDLFITSMDQK